MADLAGQVKLLASKNSTAALPSAFRHEQLSCVLPTSVRTGFFTAILRVALRSIARLHNCDLRP
jgi:hypothetical protein